MKWQYKVITVNIDPWKSESKQKAQDTLDKLGEHGWELVGSVDLPNNTEGNSYKILYTFKYGYAG